MNFLPTIFKSTTPSKDGHHLNVEQLEPRMMLSTVEIFASGTVGTEQFQLQINQDVVQTFAVGLGTDILNDQVFTFETAQNVTAGDIRIEFINDFFDAATGTDSNLIVDAIAIDGVRFETEADDVFSTGTFLNADGIQPGFRNSEVLHANGFFQFADGPGDGGGGGSTVLVRARGAEGGEQFNLILNGQVVETFTTSGVFAAYTFDANFDVQLSDVEIEFFGDVFDPSQGIDTNLDVNFIRIDGERFDTEAPTTFSTGTFLPEDGIVPGFRQSQTLHANGIFSFGALNNGGGNPTTGSDLVQVVLRGDEGFEQFRLLSNGVEIGSGTASTNFQTFSFNTDNYTAGSDLRIEFINDVFDPANGIDSNLIVDNVTINGDTRQVEDPSTFGFGTFLNGVEGGFAEGFNQSEILHANGFFEVDFSGTPNNGGGGGGPVDPGNPGELPPIGFVEVGQIFGVVGQQGILGGNPTSLQFGPDGRLYVTEQNGQINAFTIGVQGGQFVATDVEVIELVRDIQNHNDDGSLSSVSDRQVTGLVVTGTASQVVLYVSSSDPRISTNGEVNLDTNSGVITRLTQTNNGFEAVDIIRGLPRSEENHSNNGLVLSPNGNSLFVSIGGNTNNGAPSQFFSFASEYALSGAILEISLDDINSRQILTDNGPGQNGRQYVYDLPTLDDPNTPNITDGVGEDANGLDESGPFGGNDGLNQAILPADAPLRIYADGLRNAFDLVITENGLLYTVDNGSNGNLGGDPIFVNGQSTNQPNNGGTGDPEPLFLVEDGGFYGHANPTRSNQDQSFTAFDDNGNPDSSLAVNTVSNLADRVPDGVNIQDGFIIDPSRFTGDAGRLALSGTRVERDSPQSNTLVNLGSSSNGLVEFTGDAFGGQLQGDLLVAQFNGNITRLNLSPDGSSATSETIPGLTGLSLPLDVTVFNNVVFVAELGSGSIRVFEPTNVAVGFNNDIDGDGLVNAIDPFSRDAANGGNTVIQAGGTLVFDFDPNQDGNLVGPGGFGGGLTGVAVNGVTDFEQFFQDPSDLPNQIVNLDNVKFATAAGGGTTVIESVSNGDTFGGANNAEFIFQTGVSVASNVNTLNIEWTVINPGDAIGQNFQQIGGTIGTGDQSNFLKFVAISHPNGEFEIALEDGDQTISQTYIQADDLFDVPAGSNIRINLEIDVNGGFATPTAIYETAGGDTAVSGFAIDLNGTAVLDAIRGQHTINGQASGLAVGLFSSNFNAPPENTFSAIFDNIEISAT